MADQYQQIARSILENIGSSADILAVENCMTRLRLTLRQPEMVNLETLRQIPGVLGALIANDQLQIILGPGKVTQVKTAFESLLNGDQKPTIGDGKALHRQMRQKNATPFKLLLKKIASIFLPLIPAFIACGLVTGLLNIALKIEPQLADHAFIQLLKVVGNAAFWGINLFVGVNTAKELGASPMLGGTMAAVISHPALSAVTLFDQALLPGRGGIIAVLLVVAFSSWLEKKLRQAVPEILDLFLTPLLVILISTFVAILALQPLGGLISDVIGYAATTSIERGGVFTGFILGGTFLPLVMTGIHQGITPIHAELLTRSGGDDPAADPRNGRRRTSRCNYTRQRRLRPLYG